MRIPRRVRIGRHGPMVNSIKRRRDRREWAGVPEGYGVLFDGTGAFYFTTEDGDPIAVEIV